MPVSELSEAIRAEAGRRLDDIERTEGVRILAAIESGSRAWGFPSPDSDYDVRFLYVRPAADYLKLEPVRDVIERPIDGLWDINGWDLRKALQLFRKGNAVVIEWLRSPLVYREVGDTAPAMRRLAERFASPQASIRHYHGLVRGQWRREFAGREAVRLKKYFYAVRSAAALAWLRDRGTVPPMALPQLLAGGGVPVLVMTEIDRLLAEKLRTHEMGDGPRIPLLDAFIEDAQAWAVNSGALRPEPLSPDFITATDAVFRGAVLGQP